VALASRSGGPLILLFSRQDCPYCQTIKRDYLQPLASNLRYGNKVVLRQINQDSDVPITDFRGERSTHARFAAAERIKLVPVVAFYGPDGKRLTRSDHRHALAGFFTRATSNRRSKKSVLALKTR
jgi:thioredoxin-related protein